MDWYKRFGYVVFTGVLISAIATIAPVFTDNHTAVYVLAPIVGLPFVFRVLFDIASEYELVPESTPDTNRGFLVESINGGVLAGSALYIIHTSLPVPPILADRLLYVAFVTEWVVAHALVLRRIRESSDAAD